MKDEITMSKIQNEEAESERKNEKTERKKATKKMKIDKNL